MSATPITVAATIRGSEALADLRRLIDQLYLIDSDIGQHAHGDLPCPAPYSLTHEEIAGVLQQRRQDVLRQLENKGIRIAPDPELVTQPKPAESQEQPA